MKEEESSTFSNYKLTLISWISLSVSLILMVAGEILATHFSLVLMPFLLYLFIAIYRVLYQFSLERVCGFNASVVSSFFIGLVYWLSIDANVFNSDGLPLLFPFLIPIMLIIIVTIRVDVTENNEGWKHFVQGLFLAAPVSFFAILVSLGLADVFIEGNFDNWS
tara:strand:+ start:1602 stop:2093 length:492 start_codon:yes stop_codon:yes gene_type:complete